MCRTKGYKMNERFKFRVWDTDIKEYLVGEFLVGGCGDMIHNVVDYESFLNKGNYIIEQCTGLKDKNGKLVYEGDVLLCDRKDVECATGAEIHYKSSGVVQREKNGKYFIIGEDWYGSDITFYNECAEIIGNVHEQAEQKDR